VSENAAAALGAIGPAAASAVPSLIEIGRTHESFMGTHGAYAEAIAKIGPPAMPIFLKALGQWAQRRGQSSPSVPTDPRDREGQFLTSALAAMGDDVLPSVVDQVGTNNQDVFWGCWSAMMSFRGAAASASLITLLGNTSRPPWSRSAINAYAAAALVQRAKILHELKPHQGAEGEVQAEVAQLVQVLGSQGADVRWWTCYALGGIGPLAKAAESELKRASLTDPDPGVRKEAVWALRKIEEPN